MLLAWISHNVQVSASEGQLNADCEKCKIHPILILIPNMILLHIIWVSNMHINIAYLCKENSVFSMSAAYNTRLYINWMRPNDAMWQHRTWRKLVQVMAWCLVAPSRYLNKCWLIISEVLWHSPEGNFTRNAQDIFPYMSLSFINLILQPHFSVAN